MLSRKRPRVSSATGTWKPRKKIRLIGRGTPSTGLRTGGWRGVPGRRGELKYVDTNFTSTFNATGSLFLVNGLQPGTGASQRIGKKCTMKSIQLRMCIGAGIAGANVFRGMCRVMFIYDKQTNATAPTVAQILEATTADSPMNMDNRDRFTVLYDRQFAIDQAGGNQSAQAKMFKRLSHQIIFNAGAAGTVADITTGSTYFLIIAQDASVVAPTNFPNLEWYSRVRYEDT